MKEALPKTTLAYPGTGKHTPNENQDSICSRPSKSHTAVSSAFRVTRAAMVITKQAQAAKHTIRMAFERAVSGSWGVRIAPGMVPVVDGDKTSIELSEKIELAAPCRAAPGFT